MLKFYKPQAIKESFFRFHYLIKLNNHYSYKKCLKSLTIDYNGGYWLFSSILQYSPRYTTLILQGGEKQGGGSGCCRTVISTLLNSSIYIQWNLSVTDMLYNGHLSTADKLLGNDCQYFTEIHLFIADTSLLHTPLSGTNSVH